MGQCETRGSLRGLWEDIPVYTWLPTCFLTVTHLPHKCGVPTERGDRPSKKRNMGSFRHNEQLRGKAIISSRDLDDQTPEKRSLLPHGSSPSTQWEAQNQFSVKEFFSVSKQPNFNPKSEFYMNTEHVLGSPDMGT